MNKKTKYIVAVLVLLILVVIVFLCYTYANDNTKKNNTDVVQTKNDMSTTVVENTTPVEVDTIEEDVVEPVVEEPEENNEQEESSEQEDNSQDEDSEIQDDNEEEKVISIVKKDIGDTDGLSFKVENNGDGSYDVCVRDENSRALAWYTVYPKTGKYTK